MNLKIKILIIFVLLAILSSFYLIGAKFFGMAKTIYEFEDMSKAEIANQFKQIVLNDYVNLKTNRDGKTNILILGIAGPGHNGENLTDTIIILTISQDRRKITLNSVPRDLYVESPDKQYWEKINSLYARSGSSEPREGIRALAEKISEIAGFEINYYLLMDFEGFKKLVDEVGGVDYVLEEDISDPAFPDNNFGYDPLFLKAGDYHLNGDLALKISRSRHNIKGDLSRIARQHQIIKALKEKIEQKKIWNDFFAVNNILNIISQNIKTDITLPEMQKLNTIAKNIQEIKSKIPSANMDGDYTDTALLKTAKINDADVLLPKDPSYEELRKFYQE